MLHVAKSTRWVEIQRGIGDRESDQVGIAFGIGKGNRSNLKTKASNRLNLIKRLATTSWGASKKTLRQLYLGYVRSAMDYALPLQTIASKAPTEALDRVQNQAVKLICGGMRSTPIAACEIEANVCHNDIAWQFKLFDQKISSTFSRLSCISSFQASQSSHRDVKVDVCCGRGEQYC